MGFKDFFRREPRSRETIALSDPYLADVFQMTGSTSLAGVSPEQAMSNIAVAVRCVNVRSELLASVPLHVYARDQGRQRADDHALYGVLHDQANGLQSAFEAREALIRALDLQGNAFAEIQRDNRGHVVAIHPVAFADVSVERLPGGRLRYRVADRDGGTRTLLQEEMLHIRGPSRDGVLGMSALQVGRGAVALRVAQAETAAGLQANGLRPSGVMSFAERLKPDQAQQIRDNVASRVQGAARAGELLIMDGGAKFERLTFSPEDAEFLASVKSGNEDICRLFGVPPTVAGITDRATYSNTEQEGRALVQNCLGPLAKRVEAAFMRCLLTADERRTLYIEHDLSGLLRGDVQARFEAYRIGREIGAYSPNDIRRWENEPPIAGGDIYHQPANWTQLGATGADNAGA